MDKKELCKSIQKHLLIVKKSEDLFDYHFSDFLDGNQELNQSKELKKIFLKSVADIQLDILRHLSSNRHVSDIVLDTINLENDNILSRGLQFYVHDHSGSNSQMDLQGVFDQLKTTGVLDIDTLSKYDQNISYSFPAPLLKILTLQTTIKIVKELSPWRPENKTTGFSIEFIPNK